MKNENSIKEGNERSEHIKGFETERLYIRELQISDEHGFYKLKSNLIVTEKYGQMPLSESENFLKVKKLLNDIVENKSYTYVVLDKKTGNFLGNVTLWNLRPEDKLGEIGYEFLPEFWGKGIAPEAINGFIAYVTPEYKYTNFDAYPLEKNVASCRVLEKCGFSCTGDKTVDNDVHKIYRR